MCASHRTGTPSWWRLRTCGAVCPEPRGWRLRRSGRGGRGGHRSWQCHFSSATDVRVVSVRDADGLSPVICWNVSVSSSTVERWFLTATTNTNSGPQKMRVSCRNPSLSTMNRFDWKREWHDRASSLSWWFVSTCWSPAPETIYCLSEQNLQNRCNSHLKKKKKNPPTTKRRG